MCLLLRWLQIVYPEWDCFRNVQFLTRNGMKLSFLLRRQAALSLHLSLPLSLSLSVFAPFVFALALSGCRELQLEEVISKCYLWRSFSVARLGQKLKIIFLLYGTHTQIERARERKKDTSNESLLPQRKLIFSIMWREDKNKVFVAFESSWKAALKVQLSLAAAFCQLSK